MVTYPIQPILTGSTCEAVQFSIVDNSLAPLNLSGYGVTINFRRERTNQSIAPDYSLSLGSGLTVTSSVGGTVEIDSQVISWVAGTYQFVVNLTDTDGIVKQCGGGTWEIWPTTAQNVVPPQIYTPAYTPPTLFRANMTGASLTGTLAETKLASIPFVSGDVLALDTDEILAWMGKTGSGGAATIRMYLNDTDDLTTPTQIATYSPTAGLRTLPFRRTMQNLTTASQRILGTASSAIEDLGTTTVNRSSLTYNRNTTHYLLVSGQLTNTGDTLYIDSFTCETKRP